jgi:hypothetical protein
VGRFPLMPLAAKRLVLYGLQSVRLLRASAPSAGWRDLAGDFPGWYRSLRPAFNLLDAELPWLPFPVIRFLDKTLQPAMRVFEYGCGGSTLFFARRVAEVVSVEHSPDWHRRVSAAIQQRGYQNCQLRLVPPDPDRSPARLDPAQPDDYGSGDPASRGLRFLRYARSIDDYPNAHFDLILIDGRARPSCCKHALPKVRPSGCLLWDNTSVAYYAPARKLAAATHQETVIRGPIPGLVLFDQSSIFRRAVL